MPGMERSIAASEDPSSRATILASRRSISEKRFWIMEASADTHRSIAEAPATSIVCELIASNISPTSLGARVHCLGFFSAHARTFS
jgi:hypothetical protein